MALGGGVPLALPFALQVCVGQLKLPFGHVPLSSFTFENRMPQQRPHAHFGVLQDAGQEHGPVSPHIDLNSATILVQFQLDLCALQTGSKWMAATRACGRWRQRQAVQCELSVIALRRLPVALPPPLQSFDLSTDRLLLQLLMPHSGQRHAQGHIAQR